MVMRWFGTVLATNHRITMRCSRSFTAIIISAALYPALPVKAFFTLFVI